MKKRILFIITCILVLFPVFNVCASESDGYLVKFKNGFRPDVYEYNLKEINADRGIYSTDSLDNIKPIEEYVEYTSENSEVPFVKDDGVLSPLYLRDEVTYSEYEQLELINAKGAWNLEAYGNDVKVAVIDSGCILHEELAGRVLQGRNYLFGTSDFEDYDGHGTHVSGIIAAAIDGAGNAGVAPKAKIVPLKVFDPGYKTYVNDVLYAIYDAVDVYGCKVINMSWGFKSDDSFLREAINYAYSKGAILVAAVGNYSSSALIYPAAYDEVIGVASVGSDKVRAYYSQYNRSVFVSALGEDVYSTSMTGGYELMSGTSMASPMVAGVAAAALSLNPNMTNDEFKEILAETSEDLGSYGYDVEYGYGLVNVEAMTNRIMQDLPYYVSPVNVENGKAHVLVKNNTRYALSAMGTLSQYNNGNFAKCNVFRVKLAPDGEKIVEATGTSNEIVYHLWNASGNGGPIVTKRSWNK